ncbi:MAG: hypothetical protein WD059_14775 [Balneolaceae bacterium]
MPGLSGLLKAQEKTSAFGEIDLAVSYQENVNQNYFHDYWEPNPAFQIDVDTPFYAGDFFINGRFTSFSNLTDEVPAFDNAQVSVGWRMRYEIINRLKIGGSVGSLFSMMSFDYVNEEQREWAANNYGSTSPESEIGFIYGADISYEFTDLWGIRLNWNRNIIYTHTKMKLNYGGIGIYLKLHTPKWLQKVLK